MGHPKYIVTEGSIFLDDENLLEMTTDERARKGLFLGMQNPSDAAASVRGAVRPKREPSRLRIE